MARNDTERCMECDRYVGPYHLYCQICESEYVEHFEDYCDVPEQAAKP